MAVNMNPNNPNHLMDHDYVLLDDDASPALLDANGQDEIEYEEELKEDTEAVRRMAKRVAYAWSAAAIIVLLLISAVGCWDQLAEESSDWYDRIHVAGTYAAHHIHPTAKPSSPAFASNAVAAVARTGKVRTATALPVVTEITEANWDEFHQRHPMAFIDFFAPWEIWCQALTPIWTSFAAEVEHRKLPVSIGRVDCMAQADLCRKNQIMAFPTIQWFENGQATTSDYKADRKVDALLSHAYKSIGGYPQLEPKEHESQSFIEATAYIPRQRLETETNPLVDLTASNWNSFQASKPMTFVNYHFDQCQHSVQLEPTWQTLAAEVKRQGLPIAVGKVDCGSQGELCQDILVTPTLRLFENSQVIAPYYREDRELSSLMAYLAEMVAANGPDDRNALGRKYQGPCMQMADSESSADGNDEPLMVINQSLSEEESEGSLSDDEGSQPIGLARLVGVGRLYASNDIESGYDDDDVPSRPAVGGSPNSNTPSHGVAEVGPTSNTVDEDKYRNLSRYLRTPSATATQFSVLDINDSMWDRLSPENSGSLHRMPPLFTWYHILRPFWNGLASHKRPFSIARVQCSEQSDFCSKHGRFPTMIGGATAYEYGRERKVDFVILS